jgi:hypothetical protein
MGEGTGAATEAAAEGEVKKMRANVWFFAISQSTRMAAATSAGEVRFAELPDCDPVDIAITASGSGDSEFA